MSEHECPICLGLKLSHEPECAQCRAPTIPDAPDYALEASFIPAPRELKDAVRETLMARALKLDGRAGVNLAEPSPGDLERIYKCYLEKCDAFEQLEREYRHYMRDQYVEHTESARELAEVREAGISLHEQALTMAENALKKLTQERERNSGLKSALESCLKQVMLPHQMTHDELIGACNGAVMIIHSAFEKWGRE